jgi:hypothetical protein
LHRKMTPCTPTGMPAEDWLPSQGAKARQKPGILNLPQRPDPSGESGRFHSSVPGGSQSEIASTAALLCVLCKWRPTPPRKTSSPSTGTPNHFMKRAIQSWSPRRELRPIVLR